MADASRHTSPSGWGDAFAALPPETPPTSCWPAIEAALDAGGGNGRHIGRAGTTTAWPRRVAWAAALAAIALPTLLWLRSTTDPAPSRSPFAAAPAVAPAPAVPQRVAVAPVDGAPARTPARSSAATSTAAAPPKAPRIARAADPDARPAIPQPKPWPRARVSSDAGEGESLQAALEPYYMESARLERVIAAARDPRVGSGPAASLAGALDAELAAVDARLAQPGLDADRRLALWRERVDVLRTSAEFESQLRLLAVEGDALDGALVRVD